MDAGGFAFVATGAGLVGDDGVEAAIDGFVLGDDAVELGLVLVLDLGGVVGFLENILCSLHIVSSIYWLAANSNFVV